MPAKIDATTAQLIGNTCAEIATVAGISTANAGLIACGVALAVRLTDAGYEAPSLEALRNLQAEIEALPKLEEA